MQDRHFSGDDYKYPDGSLVPPSHFKQLQQREHKQAMPLVRDDVTYQVESREMLTHTPAPPACAASGQRATSTLRACYW